MVINSIKTDPKEIFFNSKDLQMPPQEPLIKIVPRNEWGAVEPTSKMKELIMPVKHLRYNQTHSSQCMTKEECSALLQNIQKEHMAKGMPDIAYNFMIGGDGLVYEGRGWTYEPKIHAGLKEMGGYYDVAYIGTFSNKESPNWEQSVTAQRFLKFAETEKESLKRKSTVTHLHDISD